MGSRTWPGRSWPKWCGISMSTGVCTRRTGRDGRTIDHERRRKYMLVLSRKKGEEIIVGDHIRLVIVEIRGDRARIGIDAPDDVKIFRSEIYDGGQRDDQ